MSEFSRVKKNKELYKEINKEDKTIIIESSLRDYERRTTDPHSEESKYQASRYRKNHDFNNDENNEEIKVEEKSEKEESDTSVSKEILRDRDLLEEFIEEVKHYNINRGLRNVQDTQMNILQNLGKSPKEKQSEDVEQASKQDVKEKSDQDLTQEIQAIIHDLDNEEFDLEEESNEDFVFTPLDSEKDQKLSSMFDEIEEHSDKPKKSKNVEKAVFNRNAVLESDDFNLDDIDFTTEEITDEDGTEEITDDEIAKEITEDDNSNDEMDLSQIEDPSDEIDLMGANIIKESDKIEDKVKLNKDGRDFKSSELLELTQTLNLKLDLHEEELNEVSKTVNVLDKVLSMLVLILVVALVGVILFGVYWVSKQRGIF